MLSELFFSRMSRSISFLKNCRLCQAPHFQRKQFLLIIILVICCLFLISRKSIHYKSKRIVLPTLFPKDIPQKGFLISTKGCRIPLLDLFDSSLSHCFHEMPPINCNKDSVDSLVKSTENTLYVDMTILPIYNLTEDTVNCCYRPFWRVELSPSKFKESPSLAKHIFRYASKCVKFINVTIKEEFVKVTCSLQHNNTYRDYFLFVQINQTWPQTINKRDRKVSVLTIGMDSVSRLNLHRQMPKTVGYLNTINAVEFLGFNKVGYNTFQNLVPILTGLSEEDLIGECWKNSDTEFDGCPFIWKDFKNNGYVTGFGEDSANIGLFHYMMSGFRKQPTDFYSQIFSSVAENDIGHEKWLNAPLCLGKRLNAEVLLDTIRQFAIKLSNYSSFGFFWGTSLTHDYLNLPKYGDDLYLNLLQTLSNHGIFESSVVILMSDHGMRWGPIRSTYQGYLEERLPFLIILYPKWFREKFPKAVSNLHFNKRKLISPFDLHATLKDLIDLNQISNSVITYREKSSQYSKGISLFLPVNDSRTCTDAAIPKVWCTCHQSGAISVHKKTVKKAASAIVNYLNRLLKSYVQCSRLSLNKVINARMEWVPLIGKDKPVNTSLIDYIVTVETVPGLGQFQANVRDNRSKKKITILPPVSRINTYDNQSFCVTNYMVKLYCYCTAFSKTMQTRSQG